MFPSKLAPASKLKAVAGITCNTFKFSDDVTESENYLLFKCWSTSPKLRETMLVENPPTAHMGVAANKHTVVMHCPLLIQHSCNPQDKSTYYLGIAVGKIKEMAIVGFKDFNLQELSAYDFSS